jgi:holo-[acyl-carrier protein] synthase
VTIHSIGSDLARIDRLEAAFARRGQRLLDRLFTDREQAYCDRRSARFTHYAGRFAVKEAVMPTCELHGRTGEIAAELGIARVHITITHDAGLAMAVAVAER